MFVQLVHRSALPYVCPSVCQTVTVGQSAYRTAEYFFNCGSLTKRSEWMADFSYQDNRCMNSKYNNVNIRKNIIRSENCNLMIVYYS